VCHAVYRESNGEHVIGPLGCSDDPLQLTHLAMQRVYLGRTLVLVQPCLYAVLPALKVK